MPFELVPHGNLTCIKKVGGYSGVYATSNQGGCGLGWMQNFTGQTTFANWREEAEWVATLYRHLYQPGNTLYCITDNQLSHASHKALLNIGARQIAEFPNLFHGPSMQFVFLVNLRDAVGRYCDKYGEAYLEPPKDELGIIVSSNAPITCAFHYLPQRPKA